MMIPLGPRATVSTRSGENIESAEKMTLSGVNRISGRLDLRDRAGGNTSARRRDARGVRLATANVNLT
jgi:hypothetical protein